VPVCADLDHLIFSRLRRCGANPAARKHSLLSAVVLKWSRARKALRAAGLLVEETALELAEDESVWLTPICGRRREREAERRAELDETFVERFAARIREAFPRIVAGRELKIAEHACLKYSGRIGRSALGKKMDEQAVRLAVIAHIRHNERTMTNCSAEAGRRSDARRAVADVFTSFGSVGAQGS